VIIKNDDNPSELLYITEESVSVYITLDTSVPYYYEISYKGKSQKFYPEDIIHFSNMSEDGINGISPLSRHRELFNTNASINNYNKVYMDNSSAITGIIETEIAKVEVSILINQMIETNTTFSYEETIKCLEYIVKGLNS